MDFNSNKRVIYIPLLNEGTDVSRPTEALDLGNGLFEVLPSPNYDPENEEWAFPPHSIVECVEVENVQGGYLRAEKSVLKPSGD